MGYTRYWHRTEKPITEEFVEKVKKIIADSKKHGITIRNWDGKGKPVVTTEIIGLNGNADYDLHHESFVIDSELGFQFCKTARKPYDYAVREILKIAEAEGLVEKVSSDGKNEKIYSDEDYLSGNVDWSDE